LFSSFLLKFPALHVSQMTKVFLRTPHLQKALRRLPLLERKPNAGLVSLAMACFALFS
jgi:hypothetical protein